MKYILILLTMLFLYNCSTTKYSQIDLQQDSIVLDDRMEFRFFGGHVWVKMSTIKGATFEHFPECPCLKHKTFFKQKYEVEI